MNDSKVWAYEQARNLFDRILRTGVPHTEYERVKNLFAESRGSEAQREFPVLDRVILFQTGYGPSGLPHIGTFGEVCRTSMVRLAFDYITQSQFLTKIICFSDDMDGFRSVPENVPNREMLSEYLGKPLTQVPDPFGEEASFGEYNNKRLCAFLDRFGFDYEFRSATQCYQSGRFNEKLLLALERFDDIQSVILPTLGGQGGDRSDSYSCFLPIDPKTGRVLQVPTLERNVSAGTIIFRDEYGLLVEVPVTDGHVKLQWKPDWAMRWAAFGIDYEMYGKDLIESATLSNKICKVLGGNPPTNYFYELFLDKDGKKISKSLGNGLSMEEWLRYGSTESLSYYMFQSPRSAKKLHFDVIPRAQDDYLNALRLFKEKPSEENPAWFVHHATMPANVTDISFALLMNLVAVSNSNDREVVLGFLKSYNITVDATLSGMVDCAINYYTDFVLPTKNYKMPTEEEGVHIMKLADALLHRTEHFDDPIQEQESLQSIVYQVGKDSGYTNLREWFKLLYQCLFGQEDGPRFGTFVAIYGIQRSVDLLESASIGLLANGN